MPFTLNGFGTAYYGEADPRPDGSFTTTEWITALYFPIVPLKSLRLTRAGKGDINAVVFYSTNYVILEQKPIHWAQVARVYLFVLVLGGWLAAISWLFFVKFAILDKSGATVPFLAFIFLAIAPYAIVIWRRQQKHSAIRRAAATPPPLPQGPSKTPPP